MKKTTESNPSYPRIWPDKGFYSVRVILRRRGKIVFWICLVMLLLTFLTLVPANAQVGKDRILPFEMPRVLLIEKPGLASALISTGSSVALRLRSGSYRECFLQSLGDSTLEVRCMNTAGGTTELSLEDILDISVRGGTANGAGLVTSVTVWEFSL